MLSRSIRHDVAGLPCVKVDEVRSSNIVIPISKVGNEHCSRIDPRLERHGRTCGCEQHTAPKVGSGRVHVLATPVMINLIEAAALAAVEHLLPPGQQSLGTHLDVRHFRRPRRWECA